MKQNTVKTGGDKVKISELIEHLKEIGLEYGNLEVWLHLYVPGGADYIGELTDMYTEERTTLFLLSDEETQEDD